MVFSIESRAAAVVIVMAGSIIQKTCKKQHTDDTEEQKKVFEELRKALFKQPEKFELQTDSLVSFKPLWKEPKKQRFEQKQIEGLIIQIPGTTSTWEASLNQKQVKEIANKICKVVQTLPKNKELLILQACISTYRYHKPTRPKTEKD